MSRSAQKPEHRTARLTWTFTVLLTLAAALQIASFWAVMEINARVERSRRHAAVAAGLHGLAEQHERTTYLALVGLATANWDMVLKQQAAAKDLSERFERASHALLQGGMVMVTDGDVMVSGIEDVDSRNALLRVAPLWAQVRAAHLRVLRSDNKSLQDNPELAAFQADTHTLVGALDEFSATLQHRAQRETEGLDRTLHAIPIGAFVLTLVLGLFVLQRIIIPFGVSADELAHSEGELRVARDELELRVAERTAQLEQANEGLRQQEEQLRRARDDLEVRVTERTRELSETVLRLKEAQGRLVSQEKLASLGSLTAGIAHEIKNPLNFVNNFADLCVSIAFDLAGEIHEHKHRLDPATVATVEELIADLQQNCMKIHAHGKRADGIVQAMLEHSRTGSEGEKRPQNINALMEQYVMLGYEGLRSQNACCGVQFETSWDDSLQPTRIIPQQIGRVILNLVHNACYALNAKKKQADTGFFPVIKVSTHDAGDDIEIRVRDNGMGIPPDVREKIFTPFFTTKPPGDGTGLGLSISHEIIQGHGGTLRFETEAGEFTEFVITLPKGEEASDSNRPRAL